MSVSSSCIHGERPPPIPVQVMDSDQDESDTTLTVHLNHVLVQLNTYQTLQIMELINAHSDANTSQNIKNHLDAKHEDGIQSEYILDINETFLHSIFGDTNAQKIKQIVDHKLVLIPLVMSLIISNVLWLWDRNSIALNVFIMTSYGLLGSAWLIIKHLLFNKVAFKLVLKTFDYWIKVIYGLLGGIALLVESASTLAIIRVRECVELVFIVFIISYISSFDAVNSTKTKKLVISVTLALLTSAMTVQYQLFMLDQDDVKITIELANGVNSISMQSLIASATRILCIFYWKQTYKTWRSKGRAVTILKSTKITWVNTNVK